MKKDRASACGSTPKDEAINAAVVMASAAAFGVFFFFFFFFVPSASAYLQPACRSLSSGTLVDFLLHVYALLLRVHRLDLLLLLLLLLCQDVRAQCCEAENGLWLTL